MTQYQTETPGAVIEYANPTQAASSQMSFFSLKGCLPAQEKKRLVNFLKTLPKQNAPNSNLQKIAVERVIMIQNMEIFFEDFEKLEVVKRLKQIVENLWHIQINFTDSRGFLRGVPKGRFFNPANPLCKLITGNDTTFRDCAQLARRMTSDSQDTSEHYLTMCHAGFSAISLPLRIEGRYLGCIFADGFLIEDTLEEQKQKLENYFKINFPERTDYPSILATLPVLSLREIGYLKELLRTVLDEILLLRKGLSDSQEKLLAVAEDFQNRWSFENIIGRSKVMQNIFNLLVKISGSDATVLITGENGTGKEGIAKAIHAKSRRRNEGFIVQNCGAINDNLLESELFGHVKGAFTSAIKDKKGLFELAHKGTLFLDEIGDTSPAMQVKLLRVLQEGTFIPVGGTEQKKVDVRVLAATNKDLQKMIREGNFREDLYYRLNVINISIPPLRERKEDIPILIHRFFENYSTQNYQKIKRITSSCLKKMENYEWPGNVRELQNEVERLCVLSGQENEIGEELLSERIYTSGMRAPFSEKEYYNLSLKDAVENFEKNMIYYCLDSEGWNKTRAAKKLDISRTNLIMKCKKYGIMSIGNDEDGENNLKKIC